MSKCEGKMVVRNESCVSIRQSLKLHKTSFLVILGLAFSWVTKGMIVHKGHTTIRGIILTK